MKCSRFRYLSNYLQYQWREVVEKIVLGARFRDTPHFFWCDHVQEHWLPQTNFENANTSKPILVHNEHLPGLIFCANIFDSVSLESIRKLIDTACYYNFESEVQFSASNGNNVSNHETEKSNSRSYGTTQKWYQYDPSRFVVGCLPHSCNSVDRHTLMENLTDFEVFGNIHPSRWLDLNILCQSDDPSLIKGAYCLQQIQSIFPILLSESLLVDRYSHSHKQLIKDLNCYFLQFQQMEAGVSIRPHIDSDIPQIDLIVTICVKGNNIIRVGNVDVQVSEGDVYALFGYARHCVKHEVLCSLQDRLTVTLRYLSTNPQYRTNLRFQLPNVDL